MIVLTLQTNMVPIWRDLEKTLRLQIARFVFIWLDLRGRRPIVFVQVPASITAKPSRSSPQFRTKLDNCQRNVSKAWSTYSRSRFMVATELAAEQAEDVVWAFRPTLAYGLRAPALEAIRFLLRDTRVLHEVIRIAVEVAVFRNVFGEFVA